MIVFNMYTKKNYRVDTNGCNSNAKCKQEKMIVVNMYTQNIMSTLTVAVATLSVNTENESCKYKYNKLSCRH